MEHALGGGGFRRDRGGAPVTVCCYICGRQFGRSSLKFHLKSCQKLFLEREAQKPKRERRRLPEMPRPGEAKEPPDHGGGGGNGFFAQTGNITAYPGADGRRVRKIGSGTKGGGGFGGGGRGGGGGAMSFDFSNPRDVESYNRQSRATHALAMAPCEHCGRTFSNPDRLAVHQRTCNPDSRMGVARRVGESVNPQARRSLHARHRFRGATFTHLEWGAQTRTGPSTPRIRSQCLCIRG